MAAMQQENMQATLRRIAANLAECPGMVSAVAVVDPPGDGIQAACLLLRFHPVRARSLDELFAGIDIGAVFERIEQQHPEWLRVRVHPDDITTPFEVPICWLRRVPEETS